MLIVLPVICVFLIIIYAFQIQNYNQETLDKCYNVYYQLKNEDYIENEEEMDVYVEKIRENKKDCLNLKKVCFCKNKKITEIVLTIFLFLVI